MDGRKAILRRAEPGELDAAYGLILERVAWMDRVGLRQWNNNGYLEAYFPPESAWYIHNFASSIARHGAGGVMLDRLRERAAELGKRALRLDCARDSAFLNDYYEKRGFCRVGECCEEPYYQGVLRQLRLDGASVGNS